MKKVKFEKNEIIRIIDGPFAHFQATVDEVDENREMLKVIVRIFDRAPQIELKFEQVERVA